MIKHLSILNNDCPKTIIILAISFLISLVNIIISINTNFFDYNHFNRLCLPTKYVIDSSFDTPVKKNPEAELSWLYAITYTLESYLKKQGVSYGKFSSTQFISLSETSIIQWYKEYCSIPTNYVCQEFTKNDFSPLIFFKMIQNHDISSNCIQKTYNDSDHPENQSYVFDFEIRKLSYAHTISEMKKLIYQNKRPILLSMPMLYSSIRLSCDDERAKPHPHCKKGPENFNQPFYISLSSSTLLSNGVFYIPKPPLRVKYDDRLIHLFIVGFNDDLVPYEGITVGESHYLPKGAFIVKGYHSYHHGKSIYDYEGRSPSYTNDKYCPNIYSPYQWYPLNIYDSQTDDYFTILKCIDHEQKVCKKEKKYSLLSISSSYLKEPIVFEDENGLSTTVFVELNDDGVSFNETLIINNVSFWNLGEFFTPAENSFDSQICGYWILPYEYIDMVKAQYPKDFVAYDVPVKFSKYNYLKLKDKTHNFHFKGPRYE